MVLTAFVPEPARTSNKKRTRSRSHSVHGRLGISTTLVGRETIEPECFSLVFSDPLTIGITNTKIMLGTSITLVGRETKEPDCFSLVFGDPGTLKIATTKHPLGIIITLVGRETKEPDCFSLVFGDPDS